MPVQPSVDELTGRPILPKDRLNGGMYYRGRCSNATLARWNETEDRFYRWREKFGAVFIETIRYPGDEDEPSWDVFRAVEEVSDPPFQIPFDMDAVFDGNPDTLIEAETWKKPL